MPGGGGLRGGRVVTLRPFWNGSAGVIFPSILMRGFKKIQTILLRAQSPFLPAPYTHVHRAELAPGSRPDSNVQTSLLSFVVTAFFYFFFLLFLVLISYIP